VLGPISFEDLQTVDGHIFDTFKKACLTKRLFENNGKWFLCLEEASVIKSGLQL